jgi:CBS domain-containing protein
MELTRHLKSETVGDLRPGPALCVKPSDTIGAAIGVMRQQQVGCLLVCSDKKVIGVFTERDLMTRVLAVNRPLTTLVADVMTPEPVTVTKEDSIRRALVRMERGGYRHLPVVDDAGKAIGILSVRKIVHYLAEHFPAAVYNQPPDSATYPKHRGGA